MTINPYFEAGFNGYDIGKGRVFNKAGDPGVRNAIFSADCGDDSVENGYYSFVDFELYTNFQQLTSKTVTSYGEYVIERSSTVEVNN